MIVRDDLGGEQPIRLWYGTESQHFGDLRLPAGARGVAVPGEASETARHPVVILIHGGFWRARYHLDLMDRLGSDLATRGIASWNIEYRRVGEPGGGWPGTLHDVARAADYLRELAPPYALDLARVVTLGHSAGGHLALWLAARPRLPAAALDQDDARSITGDAPLAVSDRQGARASSPPLPIAGAIGLAGVVDLAHGWRRGLGTGAVAAFLGGGPDDVPARYVAASPAALLPLGVPQVLVHGTDDAVVPLEISRSYVAAALAAGDDARLRELPGVEHFAPIDPTSGAWSAVGEELGTLLARTAGP